MQPHRRLSSARRYHRWEAHGKRRPRRAHHRAVQPPRTHRGGQSGRHLRRHPRPWHRRAPVPQRAARHPQAYGYLSQRLPGCHRGGGDLQRFRPLQARAVLHACAPRHDPASSGGDHPASGLKPSEALGHGSCPFSRGSVIQRRGNRPAFRPGVQVLGEARNQAAHFRWLMARSSVSSNTLSRFSVKRSLS